MRRREGRAPRKALTQACQGLGHRAIVIQQHVGITQAQRRVLPKPARIATSGTGSEVSSNSCRANRVRRKLAWACGAIPSCSRNSRRR